MLLTILQPALLLVLVSLATYPLSFSSVKTGPLGLTALQLKLLGSLEL